MSSKFSWSLKLVLQLGSSLSVQEPLYSTHLLLVIDVAQRKFVEVQNTPTTTALSFGLRWIFVRGTKVNESRGAKDTLGYSFGESFIKDLESLHLGIFVMIYNLCY
ncbi:hypothetical protein Tco_0421409 [Tanacetum coccineum]